VVFGLLIGTPGNGEVDLQGTGLLANATVGDGHTRVYGLAAGAHLRTILQLAAPADADHDCDPDSRDCATWWSVMSNETTSAVWPGSRREMVMSRSVSPER
jgi:hypothetical protein